MIRARIRIRIAAEDAEGAKEEAEEEPPTTRERLDELCSSTMWPLFVLAATPLVSDLERRATLQRRLDLTARLGLCPSPRALGTEKAPGPGRFTIPTTVLEREPKTEKPKMYRVVLYDDTRMDGMVIDEMLRQVFRKSQVDARRIMLQAHQGGQASIAIYTKEIAEQKVIEGQRFSRDEMERRWGLRNEARLEAIPEDRFGAEA